MEVTDQTQVFPGGYELRYDGTTSQWTLSRTDGSASVSGTGSLDLAGAHLDLGGAPVGGDWLAIKGQNGAAGLRVLIGDGAEFEMGRGSGRERGCKDVESSVVAVA